jgi:Patatin-like phospholipase
MNATRTEGWNSTSGKLLGWSIAVLGAFVVAYFAWRRLPVPMWRWTKEAWWHWVFAPFAFFLLFIAPIFTLVEASPLLAVARTGARRDFWWEAGSFVGELVAVILVLWAFTPTPEWWARWHWWLWGFAVVVSAAGSATGRMFRTVYEVAAPKARACFTREWKFNHGDVSSPPALGVAMSGGGIRSAAFNIGVLHALHECGILRNVDVMSAVSGGSYAMSWYLLQPFYASREAALEGKTFKVSDVIDEMFRSDGRFQKCLVREPRVVERIELGISVVMDATFGQLLRAASAASGSVEGFNNSSVRREYRQRLQRLFQGRPSPTSDYAITNEVDWKMRQELDLDNSDFSCVSPVNYRELAEFLQRNHLPFFIFNCAVLVPRAYRHMLWPTAFEFTAADVGSDVCGYRSWDELKQWEVSETRPEGMGLWKYQRLIDSDRERRRHRWVLMVNLAPAISGAAIGLSYFDPKRRSRRDETRHVDALLRQCRSGVSTVPGNLEQEWHAVRL